MTQTQPAIPFVAWLVRALTFFAVAAGVVSLGAWPIARAYDVGRVAVIEAREKGYVDAAQSEVRGYLREVAGDLRVAANLPALLQFMQRADAERRTVLAGALRNIMEAYARYERITLTDTAGATLMRINHAQGAGADMPPAPGTEPRYPYAQSLARGEAGVTFVDAEDDTAAAAASRPRLLRFTTPVFDAAGERRGVLMLDVQPRTLTERVGQIMQAEPLHESALVDATGQFFDDGNATLAQAIADAWPHIAAQEHGSIRSARGLFVFATVRSTPFAPAPQANAGPDGDWKIVSFFPQQALEQRSLLNLPLGRALFALTYLMLLGMSLLLAYVSLHLKQARESERLAAREIEDLYEHAPCGYHSLDRNGVIVRMNQTELNWLGYRGDEILGRKHITELMTPDDRETFRRVFPEFVRLGHLNDMAVNLVRKDGSLLPALVSATAVRDESGAFVMSRSTVFDATERRKLEAELQKQANTDALTGVGNRRHFFELAGRELSRSLRTHTPLALLLLDLDEFKQVNDVHGHEAGDAILKQFAAVASALLRDIDVLARVGGEEFIVLLPGADCAQARGIAERLRAQVSLLRVSIDQGPGARTISFTVSIGVAVLRLDGTDDIDAMMRRADAALYEAKRAGRNRVCVDSA